MQLKKLFLYSTIPIFVIGVSLAFFKEPKRIEVRCNQVDIIDHPFMGHGVQWSAYPHADSESSEWGLLMTDEKWQLLYDRLDYVKPRIIRVMISASWRYFRGLDEKGRPIVDYENQEVRSLRKLLDYCQSRDIPVLFGEWGAPSHGQGMKKEGSIHLANDDRWIEMITGFLDYLVIQKKYTCIQYFNLVNEPNGYWATTDGDWEQWKDGYIKLFKALKSKGLDQYVQMAGPDAVVQWNHPTHPKKAMDWMYSTVNDLGSYTGMYDVHIYADQQLIDKGSLKRFLAPLAMAAKSEGKPLILGELGMKYTGKLQEENIRRGEADDCAGPKDSNMFIYDFSYGVDMTDGAVQSMLAGFGSAIAWDLDDAMHTVGDKGDKSQLKKWGMWNILGEEICGKKSELDLRPWSYSWSLMCNLLLPNATMINPHLASEGIDEDVQIVASVYEKEFTAVVVNQSRSTKKYLLKSDLLKGKQKLYYYEYVEKNRATNLQGFPIPAGHQKGDLSKEGIEITVKPNSVFFISTIKTK